MIDYFLDRKISAQIFCEILDRSGLGARRPLDDLECLKAMVENANLMVTAWSGDEIVGVARSVTDFSYCCYLSDLAVDKNFQHQGIGKKLMAMTKEQLSQNCTLILLSAPDATDYYPKFGFEKHPSAWILPKGKTLK